MSPHRDFSPSVPPHTAITPKEMIRPRPAASSRFSNPLRHRALRLEPSKQPDPRCRHVEHHDLVVGLSNALSKPHAFSRTLLIFVRFCQVGPPLASRKVTPKPTPSEFVPICLSRSYYGSRGTPSWLPTRWSRHAGAGQEDRKARINAFRL